MKFLTRSDRLLTDAKLAIFSQTPFCECLYLMERTPKTGRELAALITDLLKNEPVCPSGFMVENVEPGAEATAPWQVCCVSPNAIAYADCCRRAGEIAHQLRESYDLV